MARTPKTLEERREYNRLYYLKNREKIVAARAAFAAENSERLAEQWAANADNRRRAAKARRDLNPHKDREKSREYYAKNKDKGKARSRQWRVANAQRLKDTQRKYRVENSALIRERFLASKESRYRWHWQYQKNKMATSPSFAVYKAVLGAMHRATRRHKLGLRVSGNCKAVKLLGCCWDDFLAHIQPLLQDGMTWGNHGQRGWHFDHIKPLSSFDLTDEKQLREACHFTNVQPLWAADNIRKGAKIA
jgi:hypothetical protein